MGPGCHASSPSLLGGQQPPADHVEVVWSVMMVKEAAGRRRSVSCAKGMFRVTGATWTHQMRSELMPAASCVQIGSV